MADVIQNVAQRRTGYCANADRDGQFTQSHSSAGNIETRENKGLDYEGKNRRENKPRLIRWHVVMDTMQEIMHHNSPLSANHGFGNVEQKAMKDVLEKGPNDKTKRHQRKNERE